MQEASALRIGGLVFLRFRREGRPLLPNNGTDFDAFAFTLSGQGWNPIGARRYVFDAVLLLLAFPPLLTLQQFVELPELAGNSHQLYRFIVNDLS